MGLLCNIFDHKDDAINFWGEEAEYILYRCSRCGYEHYHCAYEGKLIPNDEMGKKILQKMMSNKEFSKACHIHNEFVKAEFKNAFSYKKVQESYKQIQLEYGLSNSNRPADPVEMFKAGMWIDKSGESPAKKAESNSPKPKLRTKDLDIHHPDIEHEEENTQQEVEQKKPFKPISIGDVEYTNEVKPVEYEFDKKPSEADMLSELKRLEMIYVEKEMYEKAAEINEKIKKIMSKTK